MTLLESAVPDQDEGEVHCEVTILKSAVPDQDEGEVHCEVTILKSAVSDQDVGEVHCEVTIIQSADAESGNPGIENAGQADIDMRQLLAIGLLLEVVELLPTPKRMYLLRALLHNGGRAYLRRVGVVEVGQFLDALLHEDGRAQLLSDVVRGG